MKYIVVFILLIAISIGYAQEDTPLHPDLQDELETIEAVTAQIRELPALGDVDRDFPTRDELSQYLAGLFDEELPDDVLEREKLFYVAFDLLEPDVDLRSLLLEVYNAQIAGFYDPETQVMNVILVSGEQPGDNLPLLEEITYAHEFVHALQDQYFDLDELFTQLEAEDEPDSLLAVQSLIEGDATLAMMEYTLEAVQDSPGMSLLQILAQILQGDVALALPAGTPEIIETELLFPYEAGQVFVEYLYNNGGWDAVNNAFMELPQSTEQIYHPEKYLEGEMPITVELVSRLPVLGDDWQLVHDRTMGEFYLRQFLATQLSSTLVNEAATGWGGDRYHIYQNAETDEFVWIVELLWDTPKDATEFEDAFLQFGNQRFEFGHQNGCWSGVNEVMCIITGEQTTQIVRTSDVETTRLLQSE